MTPNPGVTLAVGLAVAVTLKPTSYGCSGVTNPADFGVCRTGEDLKFPTTRGERSSSPVNALMSGYFRVRHTHVGLML
jgi:hypothetical protein